MRVVVAALLAAGVPLFATGCATRARPYQFASPMIGGADLPPPALPGAAPAATREERVAHRQPAPMHTASARGVAGIEAAAPPMASADAADAVTRTAVVWSRLPAPNRIAAEEPPPAPRIATDLRALVGRRTKRNAFELTIEWANALGAAAEDPGTISRDRSDSGPVRFNAIPVPPAITDHVDPPARTTAATRAIARAAAAAQAEATAGLAGEQLLAWTRESHALHELDEVPAPGDLLVFDEIESGADADLIGVVLARDARGVTEFMYVSGGVIRRGFVDTNRPAVRRDNEGLVVNTFMRSGNRWPPKGTHYLAGELLSHVIRAR